MHKVLLEKKRKYSPMRILDKNLVIYKNRYTISTVLNVIHELSNSTDTLIFNRRLREELTNKNVIKPTGFGPLHYARSYNFDLFCKEVKKLNNINFMKIDINKLKIVPLTQRKSNTMELCIYGDINTEVQSWIDYHSLHIYKTGKYTNILMPNVTESMFNISEQFEFMDGFSPNLNKKLHIGHFSNLVLAKAFKSLDVCKQTISIYGDTEERDVSKENAIASLKEYYHNFDYHPDREYFASEMVYNGDKLSDGEEKYAGCKVFNAGEQKIVGIKSSGQSSYFYQDVCLAELLFPAKTLYLTGMEQIQHFDSLKKLFPNITHIPLGLVKLEGKEISSRLGNNILIEDFIKEMSDSFAHLMIDDVDQNNWKLMYNIFAGLILHSVPMSDKNINTNNISNPKSSPGLYLSYTMARLFSAGVKIKINSYQQFNSAELEFLLLKAKSNLRPNLLFDGLYELCHEINSLYVTHHIKDNEENKVMFANLLHDLILGCKKLGLFQINKV